jgi:hypothetical protein
MKKILVLVMVLLLSGLNGCMVEEEEWVECYYESYIKIGEHEESYDMRVKGDGSMFFKNVTNGIDIIHYEYGDREIPDWFIQLRGEYTFWCATDIDDLTSSEIYEFTKFTTEDTELTER